MAPTSTRHTRVHELVASRAADEARPKKHCAWPHALCVIAMKLNRQPAPKNRSRYYVIEKMRDIIESAA